MTRDRPGAVCRALSVRRRVRFVDDPYLGLRVDAGASHYVGQRRVRGEGLRTGQGRELVDDDDVVRILRAAVDGVTRAAVAPPDLAVLEEDRKPLVVVGDVVLDDDLGHFGRSVPFLRLEWLRQSIRGLTIYFGS